MYLNTIFKKDSVGNTRSWSIEINDNDESQYRTIAGLLDGQKVISGWYDCTGKNPGKANETSDGEQCIKEATAKTERKLEAGYFWSVDDIGLPVKFKPMLAADYAKLKKPVTFPVFSQPKLDGIRCIIKGDGMWTRAGKAITSCSHILESTRSLFLEYPDLILDGELYNHALKDDFNKIVSLVRKMKPSPEQQLEVNASVEFHCYDAPEGDAVFSERTAWIAALPDIPFVVKVPSHVAEDQEALDALYGEYTADGYEGQMVRLNGAYEINKRSKNLLKRKEFITEEFQVISANEGQGNWKGYLKSFTILLNDGQTCNSGVRGNQELLKQAWNDAQDGKVPRWVTVRYFNLTTDAIPRFPVAIDWGFTNERED